MGPAAKFCTECGERLDLAAATDHVQTQVSSGVELYQGERKQVTILFGDIVASTALVQSSPDPEVAQSLLDPLVAAMASAVERYGGTICRVMGDGIVALFGAPVALEDHAIRACFAALEMQKSARSAGTAVRQMGRADVRIRVGLNSGEVVAKSLAAGSRADYDATGVAVNLAARMEQTAEPGTIRLTRDTLRLVEGAMNVAPLGPISAKGCPRPIEAFQLLSASALRGHSIPRARIGSLSAFVGRVRELETLSFALAQTKKMRGQIVAVSGEPGLGKSRLFHDFSLSLADDPSIQTLRGSTVSYGTQHAYKAVVDLLRTWCQLDDNDPDDTKARKVRDVVFTLETSSEHLLAPVQYLLDIPVDETAWETLVPEARRRRIIDAVKSLVAAQAKRTPLVLIFEDLHWIDDESQAVLDAIVEVVPSTSLLLLINYRPEYRDLWADRTFHTRVALGPLEPSSADELLSGLLGDDPSLLTLKRLLISRTAANPLFLEESARALMDEGVLELSISGNWKLTQSLDKLDIPASVQSIIAARIDRRPPDEKTVLQSAAVIGMEVPFSLLAQLVGQAEENLRQTLAKLQAAEFLYETRLFPELEFSFKHALTHDVAYKGLLTQRRRELHARIVSVVEIQSPERVTALTELLAHHAFEGGLWDKAVDLNRSAAARALNRSAYQDALATLERAIKASEQLPNTIERFRERIDLRFELAGALYPLGRNVELTYRSEEALQLAREIGDKDRIAYGLARLGIIYWTENRLQEALTESTQAVEMATPASYFLAHHALACALKGYGRYREAIHSFQQEIDSIDPSHLTQAGAEGRFLVSAQAFIAWCLTEMGDLDAAVALGERAIDMGRTLMQALPSAVAGFATARAYREKGDPAHGAALLGEAMEACTTGGVVICFPWVASTFGRCLIDLGKVDEGLHWLGEAVKPHATRPAIKDTYPLVQLAEGHLQLGRTDLAAEIARRALSQAQAAGECAHEAWALYVLEQCEQAGNSVLAINGPNEWTSLARDCDMGLLLRRTSTRGACSLQC